jgi:methanethiol S-methyltransferase
MKTSTELSSAVTTDFGSQGVIKRTAVFGYGIFSYAVGCFGLFWLILAAGGLAPAGLSLWQASSPLIAILANVGLIGLFGLQHSVMARAGFKKWLKTLLPEATERSTYILMSGIATCTVMYYWQSLPGMVWQVESFSMIVLLCALYGFGAMYLLLSTFVTNHFELMGLRQVYLYFTRTPYTALPFTKAFMYRYSRHPMMLGMLMLLWATPEMSASRFVLALLFSIYIAVGMYYEERDLLQNFGDTYRRYKQQIATFIPGLF